MRKLSLLGALLFSVCCFSASAQEFKPGFYGIANGGRTSITLGTAKTEGNGYQLGAGYEFTKNLAAEITYGSFLGFGLTSGSNSLKYNLSGMHIHGIAKLPISESLIPYVSVGRVSATESLTQTGTSTYSSTLSGGRYVYGVGLEIPLESRISLRIQSITTTSSSTTSSKISMVTGGFIFRF